ncbi:Mitotic spindle assembly checkpoint protein MAD2B [Hondaea fermentalgiana]|uniref:Mitotic spindle assembly checkpoint protein MAD2B n=1 Tax=Hondaea fermentalgiana TaxID=2315210 RepID=A0A2R5G4U7_9STRA|nr:Mitotic spindle assembly checkpoint protein MAD2B [Hondaea fermentalgiana]|eukprot:GBG24808.1 Mitotic spindle assembly checkpoint protein MAD2B [Hondaea fermentalgiana]
MASAAADVGEFLALAVHAVLWRKRVYPRETFRRTVRWGATVWQSMHAGLCAYVDKHVRDAEAWLLKGQLSEIQIVLRDPSDAVPAERIRLKFQTSAAANGAVLTADACRCFFEKVLCKDLGSPPVAEGRTFSLLLVCHEVDPTAYHASWIREVPGALQAPPSRVQVIEPILTVPVTSGIELEAFVQSYHEAKPQIPEKSTRDAEPLAKEQINPRALQESEVLEQEEDSQERSSTNHDADAKQNNHRQQETDEAFDEDADQDNGALGTQVSASKEDWIAPPSSSSEDAFGAQTHQLAAENEFDYSPLE